MALVSVGSARIGPICSIPSLLEQFGVNPFPVIVQSGIDPRIFDDPENIMTYREYGRLLANCVTATACPHFGLLIGQRCSLASIGLVGASAREAPSVAMALQHLERYLHVFDRASTLSLSVDDGVVTFCHAITEADIVATDQIYDVSVGIMFNSMKDLCGSCWTPTAVMLPHRVPQDSRPFRAFFGRGLQFNARQAGLTFLEHWLQRPVAGPGVIGRGTYAQTVSTIDAMTDRSLGELVRRLLRASVPRTWPTAADIAARLTMDSSTLRRHLAKERKTFRMIAEEVRFETAKHFLMDSDLAIDELAELLDYSEHSAFTRAFHKWSGVSPLAWRRQHALRALAPLRPGTSVASRAALTE